MEIQLDEQEADLLRTVLDEALRDLSYEIADTDNVSFRQGLRGRRDVMQAIRAKLGG